MKWLSDRLTYSMVIFAIVVIFIFQLAWLYQLYLTQSSQTKIELEETVSNSAKISTYLSTITRHKSSMSFRNFMLSGQWLQLRQAYDNLRFSQIRSSFRFAPGTDTTRLIISLRFANTDKRRTITGHKTIEDYDDAIGVVKLEDDSDLVRMDSISKSQLHLKGLGGKYMRAVYNFDHDKLLDSNLEAAIKTADFVSDKYAYNVLYINTYRIIIPSIFDIVIYKMRFYFLSSFFTLSLTCAVFYFLLRLMRDQKLYAQARVAFTSNMTHELKTPVATVAVALQSIKKFKLYKQPAKLEKYLDISQKELDRLTMMIEKVLNLEQVDNGSVDMRPELYDVQQGLQQVISAMLIQVEGKNSKITYIQSENPCFINGDPVHLTNAFYNLMDNALKFGGECVHVIITCSCESENVIISFQDDGPGIAQIYHDKIFDRFFRIQEDENIQSTKGSGLGLNYVKSIINHSGGSIDILSQLGKGSKFIITLPVYHEE